MTDAMDRKPAVLLLEDGSRVELPELTVGEALKLVQITKEDNVPIGGEIDP